MPDMVGMLGGHDASAGCRFCRGRLGFLFQDPTNCRCTEMQPGSAQCLGDFDLVITLAGWLSRHQQAVIDYLIEENRVLKEQVERKRLRFTDEQRMRLAVKAKVLGCRLLCEIKTLVTPDTLLVWHRKLIAQK